jgi:hypothetical protein
MPMMGVKRALRIPCAIAFTVVTGTAGVTALVGACGGGESPTDGQVSDGVMFPDGGCALFCIPDGTDAGVCPDPVECADEMGNCPAGCRPVG